MAQDFDNSFSLVMPPIRATPLESYREVAVSWALNNPGVSPVDLSRTARAASSQAKAAYFVAVLAGRDLPEGFGACSHCGEVTASWCEGCYSRCAVTRQPYSSVCTVCDQARQVCDLCVEKGIDYAKGHQAYLGQKQSSTENSIEITGAFESNGEYMEIHGQFRRTTSEQGSTSE